MEKFELVDKNGNKTGKWVSDLNEFDTNEIYNEYYLPVAKVIIINNNNEILLQKRSLLKKNKPGKWGACGGKVDMEETTIEAAIRETFEEIGILLNKEDLEFLRVYRSRRGYFTVYYVRKNIDINECKIQKEELDEVKYFKIEELENLDNEGFEWLDDLKKII